MTGDPPVVEVEGVHKRYAGVHALRGVDFRLWPGEIVGLLGANGAGKSTLMKVVAGIVLADEGSVTIGGEELSAHGSIKAAQLAGISVVPQELNLVLDASVAENILLWRLPTRRGLVSRRMLGARAREMLAGLGIELDVEARADALTAVEQRLVMVAAAVSQDARVLILDEPTAALPPDEAQHVLDVAQRVRALGKTVVFVSHRLNEVSALVDRAVVMREGQVVGELRGHDLEVAEMVERLGGTRLDAARGPRAVDVADVRTRLVARGVSGSRVRDVDLEVRAGEILGVAGLVGAGRSELLRLLGGVQPITGGELELDGEPLAHVSAPRTKLGYVGEDRSKNLFRDFDITGNVSLPCLPRFTRGWVVRRRDEVDAVRGIVADIKIKGEPRSNVWTLSGGNRQKVLLGRWLLSGAKVLLLDEPTAGLDPVARGEVHGLLRALVRADGAVVVAIADPGELLTLCDRVVVLREGRVTHVESRPFDEGVILAASYADPHAAEARA